MEQVFTEISKFRESNKSLKHELGSFKDPVSHRCLVSAVVASWSPTEEVAEWQVRALLL